MKNLLVAISAILIVFCAFCGCAKKISIPQNSLGVSPSESINLSLDTFSTYQLDSMIIADELPPYNTWNKVYLKDVEDKESYEYGILVDPNTGNIYSVKVLRKHGFKYIVQKRNIK